jgi:hypothetical protein
MALSRLTLPWLFVTGSSGVLYAQAAVEYAARTAISSVSGMRLGACGLDSAFISCAQRSYPAAFYLAIIAICVGLGYLLYPKSRV